MAPWHHTSWVRHHRQPPKLVSSQTGVGWLGVRKRVNSLLGPLPKKGSVVVRGPHLRKQSPLWIDVYPSYDCYDSWSTITFVNAPGLRFSIGVAARRTSRSRC